LYSDDSSFDGQVVYPNNFDIRQNIFGCLPSQRWCADKRFPAFSSMEAVPNLNDNFWFVDDGA
jgi:hypothetical protein